MGILAIIAILIQSSYANLSLDISFIFHFYRFLRFLLIFKFVENILFNFGSDDAQKFWKTYTLMGLGVIILPKSSIGQAITYILGLWNMLTRYIDNGQVEIDNNLIENVICPVAIERKKYFFAGSHEAAQQAAMIYSFLGTCKINNIEPLGWLKNTLQRIPEQSIQKLDELLPR